MYLRCGKRRGIRLNYFYFRITPYKGKYPPPKSSIFVPPQVQVKAPIIFCLGFFNLITQLTFNAHCLHYLFTKVKSILYWKLLVLFTPKTTQHPPPKIRYLSCLRHENRKLSKLDDLFFVLHPVESQF